MNRQFKQKARIKFCKKCIYRYCFKSKCALRNTLSFSQYDEGGAGRKFFVQCANFFLLLTTFEHL